MEQYETERSLAPRQYAVSAAGGHGQLRERGEKPNIITLAWAGTVCSSPAMVSISVRPERYSHDIIEESGEFVINLVTEKLIRSCDWCGVRSGRDVDKFEACRLTALPGRSLRALR